jgi:hypothetical protein
MERAEGTGGSFAVDKERGPGAVESVALLLARVVGNIGIERAATGYR